MKHRRLIYCRLLAVVACCVLACAPECPAQAKGAPAAEVRMITDEPEAVLSILDKRRAGRPVTEDDWRRLFRSDGYVRIKRRELGMGRRFEDADFKAFVLSDALLGRAPALSRTLAKWARADTGGAARLALAYLPRGARIRAKIYPEIKPRENSFVYDIDTDPAIFLYLDPEKSREEVENHLAHEMHHIGYGTACPTAKTRAEIARLPERGRAALKWLQAFGEGFAVLAAAGGPDRHPHAASPAEERARWDRDVANFGGDLRKVERFFLDVLEGRLKGDDVEATARTFYGEQGPWYTVGWKMAAVIEKAYGRRTLVACMCDQRRLLPTYNRAAEMRNRRSADKLALWSPAVVRGVGGGARP
jgi:hypothetical protein